MNYWLSPKGKVWCEEQIGFHYQRAMKIIDLMFPEVYDEQGNAPRYFDAVDFLEKKGFIRYMDWANPHWIIYGQKPTKIQITKMFELTKFNYIK